jgi:hypothetical protein
MQQTQQQPQQQQQQQQAVRSDDPYAAIPDGPGNGLAAAMRLQQQPSGMMGTSLLLCSCVCVCVDKCDSKQIFQMALSSRNVPLLCSPILVDRSVSMSMSFFCFFIDCFCFFRIMVHLLPVRPTVRLRRVPALAVVALAHLLLVEGLAGRLVVDLAHRLVVVLVGRLVVDLVRRLVPAPHRLER